MYKNNINAVLKDERSINLGTVYESVVAGELKAHGHNLFYYDNKKSGEIDFLIDNFDSLLVTPIEIKSGKDYSIHSAISKFLSNENNKGSKGYILSNDRRIYEKNNIIYMPIYMIIFF